MKKIILCIKRLFKQDAGQQRSSSVTPAPLEEETLSPHSATADDLLGRQESSKRDKFIKGRSPIQCLNPTTLQHPAAAALKGSAVTFTVEDIEQGTGPKAAAAAASPSEGSSPPSIARPGAGGLLRTFRVDLNDALEDHERNETTPLIASSPGDGGGAAAAAEVIVETPAASEARADQGTNNRAASSSSSKAFAKGSSTTSATSSVASVPGLKPGRNSSSGWL